MLTGSSPLSAAELIKVPVLIVDDEYGPRESIAFTLSAEFAVDTADRASIALQKLRETSYAAVVMDIRMPEMDGIKTLQELRKIDADVAVIMLTGYGTLLTAQQAMVAGANQYLRKPPDVLELMNAVREQTRNTRVRRQQAQLAKNAQDSNAALKREIEQNEPQIWQARASVELVHDLNNPLTVVIGYAALLGDEAGAIALRDPALGQKLLEYSSMVEKAAEYCHHLSENWRMASKKVAEFSRVDLVEVATEARQVIFFGNPAIILSGEAQAWVRGSKYELMRIFQNLFKNALEAGAVKVQAKFERIGEEVTLVVADNGSGMDSDRLRKALHGGFSSKLNGTGLGVSICRHLVATHGGKMNFTSALGSGTTATITLPVWSE